MAGVLVTIAGGSGVATGSAARLHPDLGKQELRAGAAGPAGDLGLVHDLGGAALVELARIGSSRPRRASRTSTARLAPRRHGMSDQQEGRDARPVESFHTRIVVLVRRSDPGCCANHRHRPPYSRA